MAMTSRRRLLGRFHLLFTAVLGLAIWAGVVVLGTRPGLKVLLDWSPAGRFSVDEATLDLIDRLGERDERLEIDVFYKRPGQPRTAAERQFVGIANRVYGLANDLFEILDKHGGDDVVYRQHDLDSDDAIAEIRERAEQVGRVSNNMVVLRLGDVTKKLHLIQDLATIDVPRPTPVPGQKPQQPLPVLKSFDGEEAITSTLLAMMKYGNPKAYFVVGLGKGEQDYLAATAAGYTELIGALRDDGFRVDFLQVDRNTEIPADADVVALFEPVRELPPQAREALWRYVRRGGRLFLNFVYTQVPADWNPRFPELLEKLGLALDTRIVLTGQRTARGEIMGTPQAQNVPVLVDPDHPITKPLHQAGRTPQLKTVRALRAVDPSEEGVRTELDLLKTQPWSWIAERVGPAGMEIDFRPPSLERMASFPVGAVVTVDPVRRPGEEAPKRKGAVLVISGAAFLNAAFRPNGDLALNAFNWLAERRERVGVRAKTYVSDRLEVTAPGVLAMRRLLVFWIPGVLLVLGVGVFVWRNRN